MPVITPGTSVRAMMASSRPRKGDAGSTPRVWLFVIHFSTDLILLVTVPLLDFTLELITTAVDHVQVVVGKFAPLFFDVTFELLPVSFNSVPIYLRLLTFVVENALSGHAFQLGRVRRTTQAGQTIASGQLAPSNLLDAVTLDLRPGVPAWRNTTCGSSSLQSQFA